MKKSNPKTGAAAPKPVAPTSLADVVGGLAVARQGSYINHNETLRRVKRTRR